MTRSWDHGYAGYAGYAGGAVIGVASAVFFGAAGALAKPLLLAGWTPAAVALVRVAGGAMLLLPWVWWSMRGRWHHLPGHARAVLGYGVFGVAATQLAYFSAVETLSVSVALLLEYSAVVMVVGWMWVRHDQAPSRLTALGVALAVVGLVLVLGLLTGARLSTVGVAWALCAAVGLAVYFVLSAGDSGDALPPAALAGCGLLVGALVVGVAALGKATGRCGGVDLAGR